MIRMTRMTDYGIVLLAHFARLTEGSTRSARELSAQTRLPLPTVSKVLKMLAHHGLLIAHRGAKGGFRLTRRAEEITVAEIIADLEGPVAVTECSGHPAGRCELERSCAVRSKWRRINDAVVGALRGITLADLMEPAWSPVEFRGAGSLVGRNV